MNVGVGVALRGISRQLVKVFPVAGNVISGTIASAGTYALCEAAIAYFIESKSTEEAKHIFQEQMDKKREQ